MKHPVYEALRHNGTTYRPPGEVELDPKRDAADIRRLTRKGVIGAPLSDAESAAQQSAGQQSTVQPSAATTAQAGADAQSDESAKPKAASKPAVKAKE